MKKPREVRKLQKAGAKAVPSRTAKAPSLAEIPVIGCGASAGGLEAFTELLHEFPADTGMALVFVQHLDPKHGSILVDLLARATQMPVDQISDGMPIQPNHIYVIPPNTNVAIHGGQLHLEAREAGPHMPIDRFFRSMAESLGEKAIGVVLSGSASDGTLGLRAIKAAGGITFAQDPGSAKYDGMPRSAINSGCVDFVLPPEAIARELVGLHEHSYLRRPALGEEPPTDGDQQAMKEIFSQLRSATGVDFSLYKPGTIRRRVLRRMALQRMEKLEQYGTLLRQNKNELGLLFQDVLINVTAFFRESTTFETLLARVYPRLFDDRTQDHPVRVWVPGCATGEEAYSITISLTEYMRESGKEVPMQVFGTDLSDSALEKARAGLYPEAIAVDVSPERLRRFFTRVNSSYQIARSVRDNCIFARQNVTKDPPFSNLDLILCRNVLIYLGPSLQAAAMRLFHYALKPHGYLVLGLSESVGTASDLFEPVDRKVRIYSRKPAAINISADWPPYHEHTGKASKQPTAGGGALQVHRRVDQLLLARYSPPSLVIDRSLRILEFRGRTTSFLEHVPGEASLNLLKMAPTGLAIEVQRLVRKAEASKSSARSKPLTLSTTSGPRTLSLQVSALHVEGAEPQFLVIMEEAPAGKGRAASAREEPLPKNSAMAERIRELEQELAATRESLQSVIEEQEAGTEELKSANEEVQSSNEELQSTNEELLTAKEELQSTNEELTTVNEEMHGRNVELQQINDDLINLLNSVNVPTVMLGNDLKIRRFTPQAEKLFNLLATDVGRPISDLRLKVNISDLVMLCHEVLDHLTPKHREVQDTEGNSYAMWVRPYRTTENRIEGVVLSLFDITERKQSAEARYRRLFESAPDGIVVADAGSGEILDVNPFTIRLFGYDRAQLIGFKFWETPLFEGSAIDERLMGRLLESESVQRTSTLVTSAGQAVEVEVVCNIYAEGERKVAQFNIRDISARKRAEEQRLREDEQTRQSQKMEAVGRLAGSVTHDFNNLLTGILGYAELLEPLLGENHPGMPMLRDIHGAAERAALLTKQLLAFGRKHTAQPELVDLNQAVSGMQQILQVMLPKEDHLEMELRASSGMVFTDRGQIEQVILNLVLNARDSMPKGGTITVRTAAVSMAAAGDGPEPQIPPGDYVTLMVKDSGSGMDEQTKSRIFEPFFTTKRKGEGVGLGLATVYNIVTQSGGYIHVSSGLGLGTTMTVYLPRAAQTGSAAEEGGKIEPPPRGNETILLVDDEPSILSVARRFLEALGYQVLEATGGADALNIARRSNGSIDLLLTDVVMPQMSGREVAFQLAAQHPGMKVMYMSGHTEDTIVHHGVLQDRVAFLQKPFTLAGLAAKVREVLDRKEK